MSLQLVYGVCEEYHEANALLVGKFSLCVNGGIPENCSSHGKINNQFNTPINI
jgi:hypothetical protein